jgi:hypothetical protein
MARTVRALSEGFYGGIRRRVGDVFSVHDKVKLGKWMEEEVNPGPVVPSKEPGPVKQAVPNTFSAITKDGAKAAAVPKGKIKGDELV